MMYKILTLFFLLLSYYGKAQFNSLSTPRKGFAFGLGVGLGALTLKTNRNVDHSISASLPNFKLGYMVKDRFELLAILPGATYNFQNKTRGFEGIILAGQYWLKNKWWVSAGMGITFDAPAFYTVKDPSTAEFYVGFPAYTFSTGYEIYQKGRFSIDLQYRLFIGQSNLTNDNKREGMANMFIIGVNWY